MTDPDWVAEQVAKFSAEDRRRAAQFLRQLAELADGSEYPAGYPELGG